MNRLMHWLQQRAWTGGLCLGLASTGLVVVAEEAAISPAAPVSAEQLQTWLAELDSDSFDVREAAAHKLAQAGPAAVDVLANGVVSESAEIAWRSGAALERIALTGDEKTLARITNVLDKLSVKGKPGLRTMAAEMHIRQKHFRHDRAVASLKQNGAVFAGDGMELGGGPIFIGGGPIAVAAGPVMIEEVEDVVEIVPAIEPEPAVPDDGVLGFLSRLFGKSKASEEPEPAILVGRGGFGGGGGGGFGGFRAVPAIPAEAIPDLEPPAGPVEEAPRVEPAKVEPAAEPAAIEEKPALEQPPGLEIPAAKQPAEEKPTLEDKDEPAQVLEEFKELAKPVKEDVPADAQVLAPPPALIEAAEIVEDVDVAMPIGLDFIGGGIIGFDEGEAQVATTLMLGKQWRGGDDGLKVLKDVPEIWSITVNSAKVSDAALLYVAELPNLNSFVVRDTPVTREGLRKLRERKPNLQIQARGEAMMGVNADIGTSPLALTSIFPDSGAFQAGLREGDVIKSVDGAAVKDFSDLTISVYGRKPGEKIRVEYERAGEKKSAEVLLKKRADEQ
jgi:hypothetical protein